jgi:hypothetical protein
MRPIDKKKPHKKQSSYKNYANDLINQTLKYCHFCEMPILNAPSVEHIKPQKCIENHDKYKNLRNHWTNLLLICNYCNSNKKNVDLKTYNYYWPQKNNTLKIFKYLPLVPNVINLSQNQSIKAQNTLDLYKINKITKSDGTSDSRFIERLKVISNAIECLKEFQKNTITVNAIVRNALSSGFFSVWYEVFKNEPQVLKILFIEFKVPLSCYNNINFNLLDRNPLDLIDPL